MPTPAARRTHRSADTVLVSRAGRLVRFARVQAVRAGDDAVVELRGDADGVVPLAPLAPGRWSLLARDARRTTCSRPVTVEVGHDRTRHGLVLAEECTGHLVVSVRGTDSRPLAAATVSVADADGHRLDASVLDGVAHVRGMRTGVHRVVVAPGPGHLGAVVEGVETGPGTMVGCLTQVAPGGLVSGRVRQAGALQYGAVVRLLGDDGTLLERTRTDLDGRFTLGTGLRSSRGLTVEATGGPQSLHVTSVAVADVVVLTGTHRELGDLHLPVTGAGAVWATRTRTGAGMRGPSTRV
jgi:hypothetical protein